MQAERVFVGADVAKAELVAGRHGASAVQSLRNTPEAIGRWLQGLPADAVLAMESTGQYHHCLAQLAHAAGHQVFVLNARDVYFYAKGLGARSKTDRVDAHVIARYVAEHHRALHPWQPASAAQAAVQQLLQRRSRLVVHRVAVRKALEGFDSLQPALQALQAQFDTLLQCIDEQIQTLVRSEPALQQGSERLRTISGVGPQLGSLLACLLSRIPFANADALVAYSGLDPRANDSGAKTGRRRLSKRGNSTFRRFTFLAALSASHSKAFGHLYRSIKAKGRKPTEALVILGRKLLRIAWAIWHSGQPFNPSRFAHFASCEKT